MKKQKIVEDQYQEQHRLKYGVFKGKKLTRREINATEPKNRIIITTNKINPNDVQ